MKHTRFVPALLLTGLLLSGCNASTSPSTDTSKSTDKGFISTQVDKALAEARKELREGNIGLNGGMDITVNGKHLKTPEAGLPKAEITPKGDLLIDGKTVAITETQRTQLLAYRGRVIEIAEAGMAIGSKGAGLASTALQGVAGAILGGEKGQKAFEDKMEAEGKKLEAEAKKLCTYMPGLLNAQQQLAAAIPQVKPYATMTQADVDDCGKDGEGNGVAVMSGDDGK